MFFAKTHIVQITRWTSFYGDPDVRTALIFLMYWNKQTIFLSASEYKGAISSLNKSSQKAMWPSSASKNYTELKKKLEEKKIKSLF